MDAKGAPPPANPNPNRPAVHAASASSLKPMLAFHFLRALSRVRREATAPRRTRTIRRAAYASMARVAGPRLAWSRALLRQARARRSRALSRQAAVLVRRRRVVAGAPPVARIRSATVARETSSLAADRAPPPPRRAGDPPSRVDALRRLVPGGAGMEYCSLLEETADYVRCLSAQVQLMQGLVDLFSCP